MSGTTNALTRRQRDPMFASRYFVGDAIDIGAGSDSLRRQRDRWPLLCSVRDWDLIDGDAQHMHGMEPESFGVVYSSHCLEHIVDPFAALRRWYDLVAPGGHLVVVVPDEDLYEQRVWPSTFNADHKHTFTILKREDSWSPVSLSVVDLAFSVCLGDVVKIERIEEGFDRSIERCDQTARYGAESCIELILRKPE